MKNAKNELLLDGVLQPENSSVVMVDEMEHLKGMGMEIKGKGNLQHRPITN